MIACTFCTCLGILHAHLVWPMDLWPVSGAVDGAALGHSARQAQTSAASDGPCHCDVVPTFGVRIAAVHMAGVSQAPAELQGAGPQGQDSGPAGGIGAGR